MADTFQDIDLDSLFDDAPVESGITQPSLNQALQSRPTLRQEALERFQEPPPEDIDLGVLFPEQQTASFNREDLTPEQRELLVTPEESGQKLLDPATGRPRREDEYDQVILGRADELIQDEGLSPELAFEQLRNQFNQRPESDKNFEALKDGAFKIARSKGVAPVNAGDLIELGAESGIILEDLEGKSEDEQVAEIHVWAEQLRSNILAQAGENAPFIEKEVDFAVQDLKDIKTRDAVGEKDKGVVSDFISRVVGGTIDGLAGTDLTEDITNPELDDSLIGQVGSGFGSLGSIGSGAALGAGAGSVIPGVGTTIGATVGAGIQLGRQVLQQVRETYNERLRQTGDKDKAIDAGLIQLGASGVGAYIDNLIVGKVLKPFIKVKGKIVPIRSLPLNQQRKIISEAILKSKGRIGGALKAGTAEALGETIEQGGQEFALDRLGTEESTERLKRSATVGGIVGATVGALARPDGAADVRTQETREQIEQAEQRIEEAPDVQEEATAEPVDEGGAIPEGTAEADTGSEVQAVEEAAVEETAQVVEEETDQAPEVQEQEAAPSQLAVAESRQTVDGANISAALRENFKESEVSIRQREQSNLSPEARAEIEKVGGSEYVIQSNPESAFFARRALENQDIEQVANDLAFNPEGSKVINELPPATKDVALAFVLNDLSNKVQEAKNQNLPQERIDQLTELEAESYFAFNESRTGAGQQLQVGRLTNQLLNISGEGAVRLAEKVFNKARGNKPGTTPEQKQINKELFREQIEVSREANQVDQQVQKQEDLATRVQVSSRTKSDLDAQSAQLQNEIKVEEGVVKEKENRLAELSEVESPTEQQKAEISQLKEDINLSNQVVKQKNKDVQGLNKQSEQAQKQVEKETKALEKQNEDVARLVKNLEKKEKELRTKKREEKAETIVKALPEKTKNRINNLAKQLDSLDETNFYGRQKVMNEMLTELYVADGITPADMFKNAWYANVLSGFSTQAINLFGGATNLLLRANASMLSNPSSIPSFYSSLFKNVGDLFRKDSRIRTELGSIIKEGQFSPSAEGKFNFSNFFELYDNQNIQDILFDESNKGQRLKLLLGEVFTLGGLSKYVMRTLSAGDALIFRSGVDGMATVQVANQLKKDPKSSTLNIRKAALDQVFGTKEQYDAALAQAKEEFKDSDLFNERDEIRRAYEIMDENVDPEILESSKDFGTLANFTRTPDGSLGALAKPLYQLSRLTVPTKFGDVNIGMTILPFVNIPINVAQTTLEFAPGLGTVEIFASKAFKRKPEIIQRQIQAQVLGGAMTGTLVGAALMNIDDDDPFIAIYGANPTDLSDEEVNSATRSRRQSQLQKKIKPFTLKIGNVKLGYKDTPLAYLGGIGAVFDNMRNGKLDSNKGLNMLTTYFMGTVDTLREQATLKSLSDLLGSPVSTSPSAATFWEKVESRAANFTRGAVPASSLAKDLDKIVTRNIDDPKGFFGKVFRNIPVAGDIFNDDMLNVFGEPIELDAFEASGIQRIFSVNKKEDLDPQLRFMVDKNLTISQYGKRIPIPKGAKEFKVGDKTLIQKRIDLLGSAVYAERFTHEERRELVKIMGPKIKQTLKDLEENFPQLTNAQLQKSLDRRVKTIKRNAKLELLDKIIKAGGQL